MKIRPREPVILAEDFGALMNWYREVLGFGVAQLIEDAYHYVRLETPGGVKLAIASAKEMGVTPSDRRNNSLVLQVEVDDVKAFFEHVQSSGGSVTGGPQYDKEGDFWFGGIADPEGNPCWVVDKNCP